MIKINYIKNVHTTIREQYTKVSYFHKEGVWVEYQSNICPIASIYLNNETNWCGLYDYVNDRTTLARSYHIGMF